jgi:hypothetical protein
MSKLSDRANVDKAKYKPLSGLGPAMSPAEKAAEAAANVKKISEQVTPGRANGTDGGAMYQAINSPTTDFLLSASLDRSDKIPTKASATPRKDKGTGGPSVG